LSIRLTAASGLEGRRRGPLTVLARAFGHLASFETVFALYLLSPAFKGDPRLDFIPGDITILLFLASVGIGVLVLVRERIYMGGLDITFSSSCFLFWALISYAWTLGHRAALEEAVLLVALGFWCLVGSAIIVANRPRRVVRLMVMICLVSLILSLDVLWTYLTAHGYAYVGGMERAYLVYGRAIGLGAIIVFLAMILTVNSWRLRLMALAMFGLCFFALFVGGGRGPLIATLVPLLVPLMVGVRLLRGRFLIQRSQLWVAAALAASAIAFIYILTSGDTRLRTVNRLITLFTAQSGGASAEGRLNYFAVAIENWWTAPIFGHGIGSFSVLYYGTEIPGTYPHNIVLEVLVELGLVGLGFLLVAFWVTLRSLSLERLRTEPLLLCASMLLLNAVINALVTADLLGNRIVFAMMGLLSMRALGRAPDAAA
jgi:O-antigen ligase